ncbi:hypothetical protein NLM24_02205 [Nocardia zapadnayensis]|nr:hypothetical protein [Nocardia zapadnayensis]MCX0269543.1 hypothetical protein [Nocardia zapadnayensis]
MSSPGAGAAPPPGAEALDPTVLDLLRGSALAPMLDRPVNDILHSMGLPHLPELPAFGQLPDMPPLPTIDLSALMRPLTDLASAFGTGRFGAPAPAAPADGAAAPHDAAAAPPPVDPTQALSQISTVMQTLLQVAPSALQAVMGLWQGMGATEAAEKAGAAQADAAALEAQSTGEKTHLAKGATSVAIGGAEMAAVIAAFSAKLALAPLYATSAGGAAYLVASAVEAGVEGLVITAKTKTELGIEAVGMTQTGAKVPITNAPTGVNPADQMSRLMQLVGMVTPLIGTVGQAAQSLGQPAAANPALSAPKPIDAPGATDEPGHHDPAEARGFGGGGGLGGAAMAPGAAAAPLSPFSGTRTAAPGPLGAVGAPGGLGGVSSGSATGAVSAAHNGTANSTAAGSGPGVMPMGAGMGAAAGMARDGESVTDGSARGMVSAEHGDEVVGSLEGIAVPVVGAAETASEPPPDKELTL